MDTTGEKIQYQWKIYQGISFITHIYIHIHSLKISLIYCRLLKEVFEVTGDSEIITTEHIDKLYYMEQVYVLVVLNFATIFSVL